MTPTFRGTTVLITGASAGLGAEFARQFARRGADLVLVARRRDRLDALAKELTDAHGVTVTVLDKDLARPGVGDELRTELTERGITVNSLINNAGFGTYGAFADEDPSRIAAEIQLNVASLVDITRAFIADLRAGTGALVNVASTAAYQPVPHMAVYGATKAFVLSFTEAVAYEARGTGLRVTALSPGPTSTEFFDVVGSDDAAFGKFETAEKVVNTAFGALEGKSTPGSVVSGLGNKFSTAGVRLLPRPLATFITAKAMKH